MRALLIVALLAGVAEAHPADVAYLRVDVDGAAVALQLDVDVNLAAGLVGLDPHAVDDAAVRARASVLAAATYRLAPLAGCAWSAGARAELHGRTVRLVDRAACGAPVHALRWSLPFASHASSVFQLLVKVRGLGAERVAIVDRAHPDLDVTGTLGLTDFVHTGIAHIGVAPAEWHGAGGGWKLPDGIDHILFVLALLLGGGSIDPPRRSAALRGPAKPDLAIRRLVGVATGFTLGHSVTLALATLGVVRPPAGLIEPLIALSIVIVAAEAMTGRLPRQRWRVATAFGLVHGFGFARALDGLDLTALDTIKALFGYNLGVELGQLAIVAVAAPLVLWAHRYPRGRLATRALGALILVAGLFWVVQRVLAAL